MESVVNVRSFRRVKANAASHISSQTKKEYTARYWAGRVEWKESKTSNLHRSCPILTEEVRENDAMIERSLLRGGVGETRGVPKIVRRRVGDGVEFSGGNSPGVHVWR